MGIQFLPGDVITVVVRSALRESEICTRYQCVLADGFDGLMNLGPTEGPFALGEVVEVEIESKGGLRKDFKCKVHKPASDVDAAWGCFVRGFTEREDQSKAKKIRIKPNVRTSPLYLFVKGQLAQVKRAGFRTQTFSGLFLSRLVRSEPCWSGVYNDEIGPVLIALVDEGYLRKLPPPPGSKYSSTYTFA
jgi:hypothetical protein